MRPLELQVEGFTCFREAQPTLDLSDLHLFAIAGPTGAGKSSLLDAMIFALYGSVPRLGQKRTTELVTQGRQQLTVRLDFELARRRYRVARTVHRARANTALLEDLGPADGSGEVVGGRRLAEGVRSVDQRVESLLGLDYETFTRAVILPQGQFAAFLGSKPTERQEILKNLLRLHVYDRMRELAREQRRQLEGRLEADDRRLAEDFADATTENLAERRREAETLSGSLAARRQDLETARTELTELDRRHRLTLERDGCRRDLERLEAGAPAAEQAQVRLEAARRAAPLVPRLEGLAKLEVAVADAHTAWTTARRRLETADEHHRATRDHLEAARRASREIPELETRRRQLAEVATLLEPLRRTQDRLDRLDRQLGELSTTADDRQATRKILDDRHRETTQALEAARQKEEEIGFDGPLLARLEAQRDAAHQLTARRRNLSEAGSEAETLAAELTRLAGETRARRQRTEELGEALEAATRALEEAEEGVREAERTAQVALLRSHLHTGDDCPVCERRVDEPPAPGDLDAVATARARLAECRSQLDTRRQEHGRAQRQLASGERESELAGQRAREAHHKAASLASEVGELAAEIQAAVGDALVSDQRDASRSFDDHAFDDRALEERLLERLKGLVEQETTHRQARERSEALAEEVAEVVRESERLDEASAAAENRSRELDGERSVAWDEALGYGRRIVELGFGVLLPPTLASELAVADRHAGRVAPKGPSDGGQLGLLFEATHSRSVGESPTLDPAEISDPEGFDPIAEGERLAERVVALEGAERAAAEEASAATAEQRAATEGLQRCGSNHDDLVGRLDPEREALATALASAEFDDAAAARAAVLAEVEQDQLATLVEEHGRESHRLERRLLELDEELAGAAADAETLATGKTRVARLEEEERAEARKLAALEGSLASLEQRVERRAALEKGAAKDREALSIVQQLGNDLRSTHFQAYLLEKSFHDLVAGASVRLLELSQQRYELTYDNRQFQVLDHDNASQPRSTDTLSGGETFLASLALALELSEQVQHEAGAITLDSLFIDEGFGTLDPETLDVVASAIEALPQSGRRVGIITHLADLTRRLPHRIQVEKAPGGSRWRIEEG